MRRSSRDRAAEAETLLIGRDLRVIEAGLRWQEEGEIRARVEEHL